MAIKITEVKFTNQITTVGSNVFIEVKVGENNWDSLIGDYLNWQEVKEKLVSWGEVKII